MDEIKAFRTDLLEGLHRASGNEGRFVLQQLTDELDKTVLLRGIEAKNETYCRNLAQTHVEGSRSSPGVLKGTPHPRCGAPRSKAQEQKHSNATETDGMGSNPGQYTTALGLHSVADSGSPDPAV